MPTHMAACQHVGFWLQPMTGFPAPHCLQHHSRLPAVPIAVLPQLLPGCGWSQRAHIQTLHLLMSKLACTSSCSVSSGRLSLSSSSSRATSSLLLLRACSSSLQHCKVPLNFLAVYSRMYKMLS